MSVVCLPKVRAPRRSWAISDEAKRLETQEQPMREDAPITNAVSNYGLQNELLELFRGHSTDNWDGYGAKAITQEALAAALSFALMLPTAIPPPVLSMDPDGRVVFEWYRRPRRVFSVAIEKDKQLTYSGLFDSRQASGTEYFENDLPEVFFLYVERVLS